VFSEWELLHAADQAPYILKSKRVVVESIPIEMAVSEGKMFLFTCLVLSVQSLLKNAAEAPTHSWFLL
jgi:hypothetical protein